MKTQKINKPLLWALALISILSACKKEISSQADSDSSPSAVIAVAAVNPAAASGASPDSVYLVQPCVRGGGREPISESNLLPAITSYLATNYAGYSFNKAFSIKDASGNITGYVAVIFFNNKPVGIQFDSTGAFVKVLEQREKGDLHGRGWHGGGRFEERGGFQKDTIALAVLPLSVTAYFISNYPTDTLVKAFRNRDSSIVVISKNNGLFATLFSPTGAFINRIQLPSKGGRCNSIDQATLPASVLSYLDTTYPNYVFKKAFATGNGTVTGYVVLIDANNTKYAIEFDAAGAFVRVKTVH